MLQGAVITENSRGLTISRLPIWRTITQVATVNRSKLAVTHRTNLAFTILQATQFFEFLKAVPEWQKTRIDDNAHNGNYLADWQDGRYPDEGAELPAVFITWAAAQSYCRWRCGRLPTEAEWEYVARSGDNREFPWGDDLPSPDLANYHASGHGKPIKVGGYPPNEFGVYDLAGNVWELLLDVWVPDYPVAAQLDPVAGGPVADEHIVNIDGRRALRGASFGGSVVNLRTRWRDSHVVSNATGFVGFRCAYPEYSK